MGQAAIGESAARWTRRGVLGAATAGALGRLAGEAAAAVPAGACSPPLLTGKFVAASPGERLAQSFRAERGGKVSSISFWIEALDNQAGDWVIELLEADANGVPGRKALASDRVRAGKIGTATVAAIGIRFRNKKQAPKVTEGAWYAVAVSRAPSTVRVWGATPASCGDSKAYRAEPGRSFAEVAADFDARFEVVVGA